MFSAAIPVRTPAIRNAARLMPSLASSQLPNKAPPARTQKAMMQASIAINRLVAEAMPPVNPTLSIWSYAVRRSADSIVLLISIAMVRGPTPPGTGV